MPSTPPVGPSCWLGPELEPAGWTRVLSGPQVEDLLALAVATDLGDPVAIATRRPDPAGTPPSLGPLVEEITADLLDGRGFTVVTGWPVAEVGYETTAAAYVGLGRLLGRLRSQNGQGHLLGHVRDVGKDVADPATRIYQTDRRQTFHTDSCDAVSLLCLQTASEGGESLLVSAEAVYRIFSRRRPDLAPALFAPVATDRRGEQPPGQRPWFEIPPLSWHAGRLTVLYQRQYIDSAGRFDGAPRQSAEQREAFDLLDEIMNDPGVHLSLDFSPGDMQFVNNHALLHDRTAFVDDPEQPRHLLRLWLSLDGARELPEVFVERYGSIAIGDRGGIVLAGTRPTIPI